MQTSINNWKYWQHQISNSELKDNFKIGSMFKWKSGGLTIKSILQEIETYKCIAWTGKAIGSKARHIWKFESNEKGTVVTTQESMEGWLVDILKIIMPNFLEKSLTIWLKNLKRKAES